MVHSDEARTREAITRALPFIEPGTELAEAAALYLTTGTIPFEPKRYYDADLANKKGTLINVVHEVSFVLRNIHHCQAHGVDFEPKWVDDVFYALSRYEQRNSWGAH